MDLDPMETRPVRVMITTGRSLWVRQEVTVAMVLGRVQAKATCIAGAGPAVMEAEEGAVRRSNFTDSTFFYNSR